MIDVKKGSYPISAHLFTELYALLKTQFEEEWASEGTAPTSDPAVWDLNVVRNGKEIFFFKERFGRFYDFFYRINNIALSLILKESSLNNNNYAYVNISKQPLDKAFLYLKCGGVTFSDRLIALFSTYKISDNSIVKQTALTPTFTKETLNQISSSAYSDLQSEKSVKDSEVKMNSPAAKVGGKNSSIISKKFCRLFEDSRWLLFRASGQKPDPLSNSYYNSNDREILHDNHLYYFNSHLYYKGWDLSEGRIDFSQVNDDNASLLIKEIDYNRYKIPPEETEFDGYVDFENSSRRVLVLVSKDKITKSNSLTLYLNIGLVYGDLFIGRYVDTSSDGYISCGPVIVSKDDKFKVNVYEPKRVATIEYYQELLKMETSWKTVTIYRYFNSYYNVFPYQNVDIFNYATLLNFLDFLKVP